MNCSANFLIRAFTASSARAEVVSPFCSLRRADFLDHMIHRRDEKPARTAGRVENELLLAGVEHRDRHAANIARRKELAAVAAQIRADNFLVGAALHVDVAFQQRIHLELGNQIGQHTGFRSITSDFLKIVG